MDSSERRKTQRRGCKETTHRHVYINVHTDRQTLHALMQTDGQKESSHTRTHTHKGLVGMTLLVRFSLPTAALTVCMCMWSVTRGNDWRPEHLLALQQACVYQRECVCDGCAVVAPPVGQCGHVHSVTWWWRRWWVKSLLPSSSSSSSSAAHSL